MDEISKALAMICRQNNLTMEQLKEFYDAEFEVAEKPSEEQIDAIQMEINDSHDEWYEDVMCRDKAYYELCKEVCLKHGVKIINNPIVYTFYV